MRAFTRTSLLTTRAVRPSQTTPACRLARWKEHFEEILNRPPPKNPIVLTADEVPEIEEISTRPISKGEVKNAISYLKD